MGKPSGDGVSQYALCPAPTTPAILVTVHDATFQRCPIGLKPLPDGFEAELIQAAEGGFHRSLERCRADGRRLRAS
jgi:hypothetical protein